MSNQAFLKSLLAYWTLNLVLALTFLIAGTTGELLEFYNVIGAFYAVWRVFVRCCSSGNDLQNLRSTVRTGTIWHKYPEIL